jgi:hypothetical protein
MINKIIKEGRRSMNATPQDYGKEPKRTHIKTGQCRRQHGWVELYNRK